MQRYLLDSHVLIWWLAGSRTLSKEARRVIASGTNAVYVSSAAIWEMSIKNSLGRLEMPDDLESVLRDEHIDVLPITASHALGISSLPTHHRDPFDRIQIVQAQQEGMTVVSRDRAFADYDVALVEA